MDCAVVENDMYAAWRFTDTGIQFSDYVKLITHVQGEVSTNVMANMRTVGNDDTKSTNHRIDC